MTKSSVQGKLLAVVSPNNFLLKQEQNTLRLKGVTVSDNARKTGIKWDWSGGKKICGHF